MVLNYLLSRGAVGKNNAVKRREVIEATGLTKREIRAETEFVNGDAKSDHIVSFCNNGLYVVSNPDEIKTMRNRSIRAIKRSVKRIKNCDRLLLDHTQLDFESLWDEDEKERGLL